MVQERNIIKYYCIKEFRVDNSFNPNIGDFMEIFEKGKIYYGEKDMSSCVYVYNKYIEDMTVFFGHRFSSTTEPLFLALDNRIPEGSLEDSYGFFTEKQIKENDHLNQDLEILEGQMAKIAMNFPLFNDFFVDFYEYRKRKIKNILKDG